MSDIKKILILAANPNNTVRLRLDEEVREIDEGLRLSENRDQFDIKQQWAVRIKDLRRALLKHKPHIVHFCGHGEKDGIMLEDENGRAVVVNPDALSSLFEILSEGIECVVLNACFSEAQAEAISEHIDYVIGMKKEFEDKAAIEFVVGFYDGLGAGKSVEQAFKLGCNAIQFKNIPDHLVPVLKTKSKSQANKDIHTKSKPGDDKIKGVSGAAQTRIFLSYKRNFEPDQNLAAEILEALRAAGYFVFIDKDIPIGVNWAKRIDEELEQTDFLITLLSEHSVDSEMVKAEIEKGHHLGLKQDGKPQILPVRVQHREPFKYPLSAYLNHINWALWDSDEDTPELIKQLSKAVSGDSLPIDWQKQTEVVQSKEAIKFQAPNYAAQPHLDMPEGTIDLDSAFYINRSSDRVALEAIKRQGVTITIKAPRQMGKSSLLIRTMQAAEKVGKRVVFLDFQLFDKPALTEADTFFHQFCTWLTDELELEDRVDEYWKTSLGNNQRCTRYIQRYLLKQINMPLVLALDEVETVFDTDFRSDFFGMLRSWHNKRVAGSIWKKLDLALVTSTEPYQLIENLNQSPFNVGEVIDLTDFTPEQVSDLNQRHGAPFNREQEQQLMRLLHGQPYLVRRAMYMVASGRVSATDLFKQAVHDRGPFSDHLRYHLFRIHDKDDLIRGLIQVFDHRTCRDDHIFFRLRGAGLVRRVNGQVISRCELYEQYFRERLHG